MTMDFARRPALAGNNLKRTQFATIRGRIRRWDPDGTSIVPYFPDSVGSLEVSVDDAPPTTVYITDTSLTKIIEAFNAALNPGARAYDDGGCVALQSRAKGGRGSIAVIGGSSSLALGFDVSLRPVRAVGGEVESGPEARMANPFGVALPSDAESLKTTTIARALGRLSGNVDVLYSEHARQAARITKVGLVAAQTQLGGGYAIISPPGGPSIYTGFGVLDRYTSPEELAAFFLLIDPVTQRVAQSRVVAVVSGTVAGAPPYADVTSVLDVGNVLGTNPRRLGPVTIEDIREGRIVQASGAFASAQVGDIAEITGDDATINADPWDNRGMRWVVEAVSADQVALRPMSMGELELFGVSVKDAQPVVELNGTKLNTQNFGQVTLYTGSFFQGPNLVISPPMPSGATYEVWAAVPKSFRAEGGGEHAAQLRAHVREQVSQSDPLPNGILTRPTFDFGGATFDVGEFYARWHGRAIRIPAISFTPITGQVYWDEGDAQVKAGILPPGGHLLGIAAASGGSWTVRRAAVKLDQNRFVPATVGARGQFASLAEAFDWASVAGQDSEFVILENQQAPVGGWTVPDKSFLIRGSTPGVQLLYGASGPLFATSGATLFVENVSFDTSKIWQTGAISWDLRDVRDSHGNRTIDSSGAVDIGPNSAVGIGSSGKVTAVRGHATVAEGLDVTGDLEVEGDAGVTGDLGVGGNVAVPAAKTVVVGATGAPGSRLDTDGTQGRVLLSKTGEADVALLKDHVDLLVGGAAVDAQSLHTHSDIKTSVTTEATARSSADTNLQTQVNGKAPTVHTHTMAQITDLNLGSYQLTSRDFVERLIPGKVYNFQTVSTVNGEGVGVWYITQQNIPPMYGLDYSGAGITGFWIDLCVVGEESTCLWVLDVDGQPVYYNFGTSKWMWGNTQITSYHAVPAQTEALGYTFEQHVVPTSNSFNAHVSSSDLPIYTWLNAGQWTGLNPTTSYYADCALTRGDSDSAVACGTGGPAYTGLGCNGWQSFFFPIPSNSLGSGHYFSVWAGVVHTNHAGYGVHAVNARLWTPNTRASFGLL
jgi:hypothetical protein